MESEIKELIENIGSLWHVYNNTPMMKDLTQSIPVGDATVTITIRGRQNADSKEN